MNNGDTPTGGHEPPDPRDETLLAQLRQAVDRVDPVPTRLVESAKAAYTWRTVDEELALLQFDSLADTEVRVRSAGGVQLSFAADRAAVEVDIGDGGLVGQVVPAPDDLHILLRSGDRVEVQVDEHGQFAVDRPSTSPIRLEATYGDGRVVTEWFNVT